MVVWYRPDTAPVVDLLFKSCLEMQRYHTWNDTSDEGQDKSHLFHSYYGS